VEPDPGVLASLLHMGFNRDSAIKALQQCQSDQSKAVDTLVSWGQAARDQPSASKDAASGSAERSAGAEAVAHGRQPAADAAVLLAQALQSSKSGTLVSCPLQTFKCQCMVQSIGLGLAFVTGNAQGLLSFASHQLDG